MKAKVISLPQKMPSLVKQNLCQNARNLLFFSCGVFVCFCSLYRNLPNPGGGGGPRILPSGGGTGRTPHSVRSHPYRSSGPSTGHTVRPQSQTVQKPVCQICLNSGFPQTSEVCPFHGLRSGWFVLEIFQTSVDFAVWFLLFVLELVLSMWFIIKLVANRHEMLSPVLIVCRTFVFCCSSNLFQNDFFSDFFPHLISSYACSLLPIQHCSILSTNLAGFLWSFLANLALVTLVLPVCLYYLHWVTCSWVDYFISNIEKHVLHVVDGSKKNYTVLVIRIEG